MNRNNEHTNLALLLGVLCLAEQVRVGRRREEVVRWRRCVGHSLLRLVEVALVRVDVQLVDAVPRVHVVTEAPLGTDDDDEEGDQAAESSQVPHHRPHVHHLPSLRTIVCNRKQSEIIISLYSYDTTE